MPPRGKQKLQLRYKSCPQLFLTMPTLIAVGRQVRFIACQRFYLSQLRQAINKPLCCCSPSPSADGPPTFAVHLAPQLPFLPCGCAECEQTGTDRHSARARPRHCGARGPACLSRQRIDFPRPAATPATALFYAATDAPPGSG